MFRVIIMFIHLCYGGEKEDYVIEFESNFVTVVDVLSKARRRYGKYCRLHLFNEHRILLASSHFVEKGRSYRVQRLPR